MNVNGTVHNRQQNRNSSELSLITKLNNFFSTKSVKITLILLVVAVTTIGILVWYFVTNRNTPTPIPATCQVPVSDRIQCGRDGLTEQQCEKLQCCFDQKTEQCYHSMQPKYEVRSIIR